MEDNMTNTEPTNESAGQSEQGSGTQTTTTESSTGLDGQSGSTQGSTTTESSEETYYDPKEYEKLVSNLPPDVKQQAEALRKALQAGFTKKTQALKGEKQKIEAYNAFMANPKAELLRMAQQMGLSISEAKKAANSDIPEDLTNWQPKTWDDLIKVTEQRAYERLRKEQEPIVNEFNNIRKSNLEKMLDENAPDWRQYEDEMMQTLNTHPTLVNNPLALYKLSVPDEVINGRAAQQALKKLQGKVQSSQIGGTSTTTKKPLDAPKEIKSFNDAVNYAKAKLAAEGIRP